MANHRQFSWKIIGHKKQIAFLQKQIIFGKINHAYLFIGPKNLGKFRVADYFIRSLYCVGENKPCGQCRYCKQIQKAIYPDIHYIEPLKSKKITVDQIREIRKKFAEKPWENNWQIAVINEAHLLNTQAANALLKTLEEPAKKQVIILLAQSSDALPNTIRSRCQILKFFPVNKKEIDAYLSSRLTDKQSIELLATLANGFPEIALKNAKNKNAVKKYQDTMEKSFAFFKKHNLANKIEELDKLAKQSEQIKDLITTWILVWRDVLLIKNNRHNYVVNRFALSDLNELAARYSANKIKKIILALNTILDSGLNINMKMALENMIINYL